MLRPWRPGDGPALAAAWADPEVRRWTAVPDDRSVAAAERWITGEAERRRRGLALDLAVTVADESEPVGEVGVTFVGTEPEIGYWTAAGARGVASPPRRVPSWWTGSSTACRSPSSAPTSTRRTPRGHRRRRRVRTGFTEVGAPVGDDGATLVLERRGRPQGDGP
ncbi:MAG: GNAT family N-acetyltransferase [Acidimicrobiia bacterium]|nr:GNAT family N-acetyltransferase [Acidimicrobiia bacterium]